MKIIFMGTPEFSVFFLNQLVELGYEIPLVVTQPDRQAGRGRKLQAPAVKVRAEELGIEVYQPENLKDPSVVKTLQSYQPDLFLVVAYSLLPKALLEIPTKGSMNIHTSLLPKFRGAAPIQWALAKGEKETGLSLFLLDEKMDHGPIVEQEKVAVEFSDTSEDIYQKFLNVGGGVLKRALEKVATGNFSAIPQDHSLACPAPKLKKEDGLIDWSQTALQIHNLIRGFYPWPCGYSFFEEKVFKILKAVAIEENLGAAQPGELLLVGKKRLFVACGEGFLELLEVQPEGKKAMDATSFINGLKNVEGLCLKKPE